MIRIKNSQKSVPFSVAIYKQKASLILHYLGYQDFDLLVWITGNRTIQKYNAQFRNINKPTDILSFPHHLNLAAGKKIQVLDEDDKNLGDVIISIVYVRENAKKLPGTLQDRMDRMLVHGICHLLGYDHETDIDYKKMWRLEKKLLKIISVV